MNRPSLRPLPALRAGERVAVGRVMGGASRCCGSGLRPDSSGLLRSHVALLQPRTVFAESETPATDRTESCPWRLSILGLQNRPSSNSGGVLRRRGAPSDRSPWRQPWVPGCAARKPRRGDREFSTRRYSPALSPLPGLPFCSNVIPTARAVGYGLPPLRGFSKCRLSIGDTRARKWPISSGRTESCPTCAWPQAAFRGAIRAPNRPDSRALRALRAHVCQHLRDAPGEGVLPFLVPIHVHF